MKNLETLLQGVLPNTKKESDLKITSKDIHDQIKGNYCTEANLVYEIVKRYPINQFQEDVPEIIVNYSRSSNLKTEELIFLDTETTGLTGGTGTYTFLVGCGYLKKSFFILKQFIMKDPAGEGILLEKLLELFSGFKAMVTFNGKSFDIPLLKTRFTLHALHDMIDPFYQIDLLHLARRLWKSRLSSCNLQNLEDKVLQITRDQSTDIPGSEIPWVYFDYLDTGDATFLVNVINHNQRDIFNMFLLWERIVAIMKNFSIDLHECSPDWLEIARLSEEFGDQREALIQYRKLIDKGYRKDDARKRMAALYKSRGDFVSACNEWDELFIAGDIDSGLELAKYFEHQIKDYKKALKYTSEIARIVELIDSNNRELLDVIEHRKQRIIRKINGKRD